VTLTGADNVEKQEVLKYLSNHAARAALPETPSGPVSAGYSYSANMMYMTTLHNGEKRYLASASVSSDGKYQLVIAPVDDINQYLPRIDFGQAQLGSTPRTLNIQVALRCTTRNRWRQRGRLHVHRGEPQYPSRAQGHALLRPLTPGHATSLIGPI
jgi:hypothetical protein